MNSRRIKQILRDPDFVSFCDLTAERLTKKVMSQATTPEDRLGHLAEYHALERLLKGMEAEAQNIKDDKDE